jgi:CubicO group peptidase (beta-lactamase class C family)
MKFFKKLVLALLTIFLLLELVIYVSGYQYLNTLFKLTILQGRTGPDIYDLNDFPSAVVQNGQAKPWPKSVRYGTLCIDSADKVSVDSYKTTALLVIQNDSILYENYNDNAGLTYLSNSFSMAKSIQSILIGIALKQKYIVSVNDPIRKYLPELDSVNFHKIAIKHLLWMASGLDFNETYSNPLAWPAKAYYGTAVNETVLNPKIVAAPGTLFSYKGGDTQLLGMLLKKVTGKTVAQFASEELWSKIGSEFTAKWGTDLPDGMEKVSCCFYATAHDFARIGKLLLNQGNWNGIQLLDSSYIQEAVSPSLIKNSVGLPVDYYGYQWWLATYKNEKVFYARGILGQYIFCVPRHNLLIVRLGHLRASKTRDEMPADAKLYLKIAFKFAN